MWTATAGWTSWCRTRITTWSPFSGMFLRGGALSAASFASPVSFTVGSHPREVIVRDLDGDGRPDIAVANIGDDTISILKTSARLDRLLRIPLLRKSSWRPVRNRMLWRSAIWIGTGNLIWRWAITPRRCFAVPNVSVAGTLNSNSFAARVDLPANYYCNSIVLGDWMGTAGWILSVGRLKEPARSRFS